MKQYRVDAELIFEGEVQGGITLTFEAGSVSEASKMAEEMFEATLNECHADIFSVTLVTEDEVDEVEE